MARLLIPNQIREPIAAFSQSSSGQWVSEESALRISTVFACVKIISESIASLPLSLYRRSIENGREVRKRAFDKYSLYYLLYSTPNSYQTAFQFRESLASNVLLWGNGYAEIEYSALTDTPIALHLLHPSRVDVVMEPNGTGYNYFVDGKPIPDNRILHIRGFGTDGVRGISVIGLAREAAGLALATENMGATLFRNGARPGGVIKLKNQLKDDAAAKRLKESWKAMYTGENRHDTAILEDGAEFQTMGIPPEDAQFLQTRQFQVDEICRFFRVPLHMVNALQKATLNNIEQLSIEFVVHTLRPWLIRFEQEYNLQLLSYFDRNTYFWEHSVDALLRGDIKARYEAYAVGRQWGWLSVNDILSMENKNPIPNGDIYLEPLNMKEAGWNTPIPGGK